MSLLQPLLYFILSFIFGAWTRNRGGDFSSFWAVLMRVFSAAVSFYLGMLLLGYFFSAEPTEDGVMTATFSMYYLPLAMVPGVCGVLVAGWVEKEIDKMHKCEILKGNSPLPEPATYLEFIHELARLVSYRLDGTQVPEDYRVVIAAAITMHSPRDFDFDRVENYQDVLNSGNGYKSIPQYHVDEISHWVRLYPQHVFSLLIGLASGLGEDHAWGMAYG